MHPYLFLRKDFLRAKKLARADPSVRVLLALDGFSLDNETLATAFVQCLGLSRQVDVLVANCNFGVSPMLRDFLGRLNQYGIEYRLTLSESMLASQVAWYTQRFPGIRTVVTNDLPGLKLSLGTDLGRSSAEGYRWIGLAKAPRRDRESLPVRC